MRADRAVPRLLAGLVLIAAAAACKPGPHPPTTTTRPAVDTVLITWDESGGHCREMCPTVHITVDADGSWVATRGATSTTGQLGDAARREATQQVRTGLESLTRLAPSSGCPSAYDGRDIEIRYSVDGRAQTVSNCTRSFGDNALIAYTAQLVHSLAP